MGNFHVSRGPPTVQLTQIFLNTFFLKSQNPGKVGTLCKFNVTPKVVSANINFILENFETNLLLLCEKVTNVLFLLLLNPACAICGVLCISLPIPIIVNNFNKFYEKAKIEEEIEAKRKKTSWEDAKRGNLIWRFLKK